MSDPKIHALSAQLCDLLGANSSDKNVDKVSSVLMTLLSEIAETNTKAYNKIVRSHCCNDADLAQQITTDIKEKRDTLIANLSALR
ncbi:MAG: hypothetical protein V3V09_02915 [Arenicellales bacterium]